MLKLKVFARTMLIGMLPALAMTLAVNHPLAAQKTVRSGTTTTYNGVPACDCEMNNGQCGCVQ
jgi:hypothetical protein